MSEVTLTIDGTEYVCISKSEYARLVLAADTLPARTLEDVTTQLIKSSFARHQGHRGKVCKELQVSPKTVKKRLDSLNLGTGHVTRSDKYALAAKTWWDMLSRESRNLISRQVEIKLGYLPSIVEMYEQIAAGQPAGGEL